MATSTQINELDKNIQAVKAAGPPSSSMPPLVSFPMAGNINNMSRRFDNGFAAPTPTINAETRPSTYAPLRGVVPEPGPDLVTSGAKAFGAAARLPGAVVYDAMQGAGKAAFNYGINPVVGAATGYKFADKPFVSETGAELDRFKNNMAPIMEAAGAKKIPGPPPGAISDLAMSDTVRGAMEAGRRGQEGVIPDYLKAGAPQPGGAGNTASTLTPHEQWIEAFASNKFQRPIEMKMPEGLMHISTDGAKAKTIYVPTGTVRPEWKSALPKGIKLVEYNPTASYLKDQGAPAGPGGVVSPPGGTQKLGADGMMEISKQLTKLANNNGVVGGASAGPTYHGQPYAEVFGKDYSPADPGLPPPDRSSSDMAREHMAKLGKTMDFLLEKAREGRLMAPGADLLSSMTREYNSLSSNDQTNSTNIRKVAVDESLAPSQRFANYGSTSAQMQAAGRESGGNKDYTTLNAVVNGYTKAYQEILKQDLGPEVEAQKLKALQDVYAPLLDQFGGGKAGGGEPEAPAAGGARGKPQSRADLYNKIKSSNPNLTPTQINKFISQSYPGLQ